MTVSAATDPEAVVLDASAMVDLLTGQRAADVLRGRLRDAVVHVPAHFDAEVLCALGRLHRADQLSVHDVSAGLDASRRAPMARHPLPALLDGAWTLRDRMRLIDALYAALADQLDAPLVTTDARLAQVCPRAELP